MPQRADIHPDVWDPIVAAPDVPIDESLRKQAGPKYSYRELDDFTDRIEKAIKVAPEASRVNRVGLLEEQVEIQASQSRLAAFGVSPMALPGILQNRNTTFPAGTLSAGARDLELQQSGEFRTLDDINNTVLTQAAYGTPLYLRNLAMARRSYQHPSDYAGPALCLRGPKYEQAHAWSNRETAIRARAGADPSRESVPRDHRFRSSQGGTCGV
jgi:hypothetical protein